jgi:hypothetical protein
MFSSVGPDAIADHGEKYCGNKDNHVMRDARIFRKILQDRWASKSSEGRNIPTPFRNRTLPSECSDWVGCEDLYTFANGSGA